MRLCSGITPRSFSRETVNFPRKTVNFLASSRLLLVLFSRGFQPEQGVQLCALERFTVSMPPALQSRWLSLSTHFYSPCFSHLSSRARRRLLSCPSSSNPSQTSRARRDSSRVHFFNSLLLAVFTCRVSYSSPLVLVFISSRVHHHQTVVKSTPSSSMGIHQLWPVS